MKKETTRIIIYGADILCASCVNLPSSKDTYEWLEAALQRKFPGQPFSIDYVDIFNPPNEKELVDFSKRVVDDEFIYPVVVIDDKVVGEGNPKLKAIVAELATKGFS